MVCEDDESVRREVEALLSEHDILAVEDKALGFMPGAPPVDTIGDYQLKTVLGTGGLGTVYRADHPTYGTVALKVTSAVTVADTTARTRFEQEARVLNEVRHRSLCHLHEAFVCEQGACIAMEFVDGVVLSERLESGAFSYAESLNAIKQLVEGLSAAHMRNIVHRDIKPANVMQLSTGEIKLIDFGIAKFADTRLTRTGQVIGTPAYMAPEQWHGRALDVRTDLWAVGALWFELLSGYRAFPGEDTLRIAESVLGDLHPELPAHSVDGQVLTQARTVIDTCLQRDPDRRYADSNALLQAVTVLV